VAAQETDCDDERHEHAPIDGGGTVHAVLTSNVVQTRKGSRCFSPMGRLSTKSVEYHRNRNAPVNDMLVCDSLTRQHEKSSDDLGCGSIL
jgi:hypothetical protein